MSSGTSDDQTGFGIDFGTTNSVVAVAAPHRKPLPLLERGAPHPSFVWFGPDEVIVGREAKRRFHTFVDQPGHRFIRSVKRELGKNKVFEIGGSSVTAVAVAEKIFRHLKKHAAGLTPAWQFREAVVAIPVTFRGPARAELRRAAAAAGINIRTFVHEPFAAVVGHYAAMGRTLSTLTSGTVLVFDWGGGTLDVTLVRVEDGRFEELSTSGLEDIAGDHFDSRVRDWAQSAFLSRTRLSPEAFSLTRPVLDLFVEESERAKIEISSRDRTEVSVPQLLRLDGSVHDLREELTRLTFERLIQMDVQAALHQVDLALERAHLTADEVNKVLLIGGSSLIPLLREEIERRFGPKAIPVTNSQTVIAEGAAYVAREGFQPFLSHPIVLRLANGSGYTVFDRGTNLPTPERQLTLFVTDNRDGEARLLLTERLRQGDASASRPLTMVSVPVMATLPRPYNHERIYAKFTVDDDLILRVRAHGAAAAEVKDGEVHDLTFGLRFR